jgi:hypothetical protein
MLVAIVLPTVLLAAMALAFRQPVGALRTAEALLPALFALFPLPLWLRLDPISEAAAWFPLLALAMSSGFWVLSVLSLSGRQWPRQSAKSQAASATVWVLTASFGFLQAPLLLPGRVAFDAARFSYAPWSLLITALFFSASWLYFRGRSARAQGA